MFTMNNLIQVIIVIILALFFISSLVAMLNNPSLSNAVLSILLGVLTVYVARYFGYVKI